MIDLCILCVIFQPLRGEVSTEDGSENGVAGEQDSNSEESFELEVESNAESENTVRTDLCYFYLILSKLKGIF